MSNLLLKKIDFSSSSDKPFFFTSYVTTIDGKIFVKKPGYWPIGSRVDFDYFTFLRAHADVIVEGKNTALLFGDKTLATIKSEKFLSYRKLLGKEEPVDYIILSRTFDETFSSVLQNSYQSKPLFVTSSDSLLPESFKEVVTIERLDTSQEENLIPSFIEYVKNKMYQTVFLDVGPVLLAEFIKLNSLNELFLTVSPKFFGHSDDTVSIGDFPLFASNNIPTFSLLSSEQVGDEVFLRYQFISKDNHV